MSDTSVSPRSDASATPVSHSHSADEPGAVLARLIAPVRFQLRLAAALEALAALGDLLPIVAIVAVAARLSGEDPTHWQMWTVAAVVGIVVTTVSRAASASVGHSADLSLARSLRSALTATIARLPLGWFDGTSSGRVASLVDGSVKGLHTEVAHKTPELVGAVAATIATAGYLAYLNVWFALGLVIVVAALFWWQQALTTAMTPQYAVFVDAQGQMAAALTELVRGIDVAKSFASRESDVGPVAGYRRAAASMTAAVEGATIPGGLQRALVRTLSSSAVLTAGAAGVGALLYWQGLIGPAPLIGFGLLAGSFSQAATPLLTRITTSLRTRGRATTEAQAHALAIDAVLREEELSVVRATESARPDSPAVVLDRVGFAYDGRDRVLDEFSLTLPTGTVTALVGPSGSGKSTIAELIARFHDPQDGRILLEGDDLRTLSPTDLYRRIAFVFQDIDLLDATVAENIALGCPDASHAEIVDVARRVRIDEVIAMLPDGYDTPLTSTSLSTGQRQRLAIARILLTDPRVVVIDEATSAADPESEAAVQQALSELARDRTVLVVAHRLHTVVDADQIVVLDDGVIAEHGTHRDLLDARGAYARLWEAGR